MLKHLRPLLSVLLLITTLASCSTVKFYSQAAIGQWEILAKKQPVDKLIAAPSTPEKLRTRLTLTQSIRTFAGEHLSLPTDAYDHYTDLKRPHVTWVIFAAPELSMTPKHWHYPIVGKLDYRGYFKEKDARVLFNQLKAEKYDVAMGGVDAYSTLGYLRDPLLNTFIFDPEIELAELLFHELTHRKVFLSGDTDFNEAFATAVAQEGVIRWLQAQGRIRDLAQFRKSLRQKEIFTAHVIQTRDRLKHAFSLSISDDEKRRLKRQEYARLASDIKSMKELAAQKGYQSWITKPINNARVNTVSTYHKLVPAFHRLLHQCHGDLPTFYQKVADMKSLTKAERRKALGVEEFP